MKTNSALETKVREYVDANFNSDENIVQFASKKFASAFKDPERAKSAITRSICKWLVNQYDTLNPLFIALEEDKENSIVYQ